MAKYLKGLTVALLSSTAFSATVAAQDAQVTADLHMRAGPSTEFPVVTTITDGSGVEVYGRVNSYNWCDVVWRGNRGWVFADHLNYSYQDRYVPIVEYGPRIDVPIISFSFGTYWDDNYRDRPWFDRRDRWRAVWGGNRDWDDDERERRRGRRDQDRDEWRGDWRENDRDREARRGDRDDDRDGPRAGREDRDDDRDREARGRNRDDDRDRWRAGRGNRDDDAQNRRGNRQEQGGDNERRRREARGNEGNPGQRQAGRGEPNVTGANPTNRNESAEAGAKGGEKASGLAEKIERAGD